MPQEKWTVSARYSVGRLAGLARATSYGVIHYRNPGGPANDERFSAKTLFDVDLGYQLGNGIRVAGRGAGGKPAGGPDT